MRQPPGGSFNDNSQLRGPEANGVRFNLNTGALIIGELQYALNPAPTDPDVKATGLPGTYKLGFYRYRYGFVPRSTARHGRFVASKSRNNGIAVMIQGNYSFYGIADQVIWQPDLSAPRALSAFIRVMGTPPVGS